MKQNGQNWAERTIYFDYIRVFATFAVMILHLSGQNWHSTDVNGFDWQVFNFFDSIVRWGVPVFVMISGALFLNRDIPLKTIYTKYILRMVISYVIWSSIYALSTEGSMVDKIMAFATGHYHMWFILMIVGLYMCVPFIKPIAENDNKVRYFLLLAFFFAFVIPEFFTLANDFGNGFVIEGANAIRQDVNNMNMHIVLGYASYFVLGYYVNKIVLSKRQRMMIYVMGAIGFAATIGLDLLVALKTQTYCFNYYGYFTVNVLFEALAIFTWFKYRKYQHNRINEYIQKLSKYSFGAYLIHALVIEQLNLRAGLNTLSFNSAFAVLFIGMIVFVISFSISALLNQIPIIKKYMV